MLVHAGFVFTYTPVAAGPLKGQDARKVLLEADRLFSKNPPSPPLETNVNVLATMSGEDSCAYEYPVRDQAAQ